MHYKQIIIIFLFVVSGTAYYLYADSYYNKTELTQAQVQRIIDGDTIELDTGERVRLKGINTPEKGEPYYLEAKEYLEKTLLNNTILLENQGTDKYQRILGYIHFQNKLINEEIIRQGLATLYVYEEDKHTKELTKAETETRAKQKGIWKTSPYYGCINLIKLKYEEQPTRCTNNEQIILENICEQNLDITFKDDATHLYKEHLEAGKTFTKNFSCIFNNEGDSLYIYHEEGLLLFYRY